MMKFMFYLRHSESSLSRCSREKTNLYSERVQNKAVTRDCHLEELFVQFVTIRVQKSYLWYLSYLCEFKIFAPFEFFDVYGINP